MSRDWLNDPANPGTAEWSLAADDLYTGVMAIDLRMGSFRVALSSDFKQYRPVLSLEQLLSPGSLG
jgi:hypothetical protein